MALWRLLSLFHRSGNAASATPYFGHRVQRALKANSWTAAGSARPASGHCLQRLPHQAINTYNNASVKPIRFGSSSSSSPPAATSSPSAAPPGARLFFVIYNQCFHCHPSPRLIFYECACSATSKFCGLLLPYFGSATSISLPWRTELLLCSCGP